MPADDEIKAATGSVVTVELRYGDKFLLVKRPDGDEHYPGYWAFPGGRVRAGESFVSAAERECEEETGIPLTGYLYFVDSYPLEEPSRVGIHFAFEASSDMIFPASCHEYRWVTSAEMKELQPRIAGIDNHAVYSAKRLSYSRMLSDALDQLEQLQAQVSRDQTADTRVLRDALKKLTWSSREEAHLSPVFSLGSEGWAVCLT